MRRSVYNLGLLFSEVSSAYSDLPAIKYATKSWSYSELDSMADRMASLLLENGLRPGDVVAIVNTKEIESYAMMLACLKTGVAYTNIDRDNPVQRNEAILRQCEPALLVTDSDLKENLQRSLNKFNIPLFFLKEIGNLSFSSAVKDITPSISGSRIAYIMFTSGSTGVPKGVAITHQNVLHFISWSVNRFEISPQDIFANISPMFFDNSAFDFYTSLFSGASLAPIKKPLLSHPKELLSTIDALGCTIWFSVPSMLLYLLTMRALDEKSFRSIRTIVFGGEGFPKTELKKLYDYYRDRIAFVNVYGPTEGTCICSSYTITDSLFSTPDDFPSLGPINPNFEYIIMDETGNRSKRGELCILGPNIGLGYYKDAELTSSVFSVCYEHGFYGVPMYRTGDLVYEETGNLFFIGRKDNQIKHMGYRIELEEIELALNVLDGVSQAAAIYERVSEAYGKIVAFIACEIPLSQNQIRRDLKIRLPEYMLPNVILFYDALPKNPNGKVDKRELRAMFNLSQKNSAI